MSAPDAQSVKYILLKPSDGLTKEHDKDAALMFGFIESVVVRSIEYAKERGTFPKSTWDRCDFRAKETKTAFEKLAGWYVQGSMDVNPLLMFLVAFHLVGFTAEE